VMMHKLISALPFMLASGLACSQAASTEVPIEPTAGTGAVIAFGVIVLVVIVGFLVFMAKQNSGKDKDDDTTTPGVK